MCIRFNLCRFVKHSESYSLVIDDFMYMFLTTRYYSREDTEDACKYISGTILDDRPIRVDFDWGFQEGRQWGRGRSGGQVNCGSQFLPLFLVASFVLGWI